MRGPIGAMVVVAASAWPLACLAQRDGVADALAGHQAEMNQLAGKDPMRRAYFFDPVAVEGPDPGVPCDHIAQRRPEAVAGPGKVVLLESVAEAGRMLRFWLPPGAEGSSDPVAAAADYAGESGFGPYRLIGVRQFSWCR
ncbi:MAG TPA: hypothetical protein PLQ11_10545 [Beijerinckiaceae bacterium]|nr:hypothetical protein [Beijerinckiaceae bacterium]